MIHNRSFLDLLVNLISLPHLQAAQVIAMQAAVHFLIDEQTLADTRAAAGSLIAHIVNAIAVEAIIV